jgi:putative ABC transport system permease protein
VSLYSLDTVVQLAFLYGISALAVAFAFRVIGFPDLTPDGSFVLGAAMAAVLALKGFSLVAGVAASVTAGALAGVTTALLHTRIGISRLLSGILIMLSLYSVSLRIMGTSNLSLLNINSPLNSLARRDDLMPIIVTFSVCAAAFFLVVWLLQTRTGIRLRAAGDSESALELRGHKREPYYIIGLGFSNALSAGGGAIIAFYQGFADVSMGTGLVVTCLAAIVMGETLVRPEKVLSLMACPVIGMFLYQFVLSIALRIGFTPADLKISTAVLALIFVTLDRLRTQRGAVGRQIGNRAF